jgi:hypothetical protein
LNKHINLVPKTKREDVKSDVNRLHYSKTSQLFESNKKKILAKWRTFKEFNKYFHKQWLDSDFKNWQIFNRPVGMATTNGPIESYNNRIKKFFTDRKKFNLLPAIQILSEQIKYESNRELEFYEFSKPSTKMVNDCKLLLEEKNNLVKLDEMKYLFKSSKITHRIELSNDCSCPECCYCSCSFFFG